MARPESVISFAPVRAGMLELLEPVVPALMQGQPPTDPGVQPATGLLGGAVGAFLTTLVVGAILIALAPSFTEQSVERVQGDPVGSFAYGVVALLALVVLIVVLVLTIIGIFLAIPLAVVAYVLWAVGSVMGYLAIGERLVGRDGWWKPLAVGAAINGVLALTGIGGIIAFLIGATGFGAVLRGWLS